MCGEPLRTDFRFPFGSSLEPVLKPRGCCQDLLSDFFFFLCVTPFRVYKNVFKGSGLLLVSFLFLSRPTL